MAADVDEFLRNVLRSELLDRPRLREALQRVPSDRRADPQAVADVLVADKLLTSFQAGKLLAGVTLGLKLGAYRIQKPIGRGGMGTVYLALDERTAEPVAIKVVSPQRVKEGERHLARFRREMVLSQKLKHPNVALTKEVGDFKGVHYLVLEFIPGVTLYRLVVKQGPLPPARAAKLFAEVSAALEHAHEQGLIHRDLKPTNVMVTPDEHAKVLDLGLALMIGEEVEDPEIVGGKGYVVGSVDYIAPEQTLDPTQVDARADLYSLGCTLYFALCGTGPFSKGTAKEKLRAHRRLEAEPLRSRNPEVPEGLADLTHRLMAKNPADRPASAAAVREELARFAVGSETAAPLPESMFEVVDESDEALEGGSDTLSEVFLHEPRPESMPTFEPIRNRKSDSSDNVKTAIWFTLGLLALAVLSLLIGVIALMFR